MDSRERFFELCKAIERPGIEDFLSWLENSDFFEAPASTRFHLSCPGGLLQHSLNVFDELNRLCKAYPEVEATPESIAICSLFHDICKVNTYKKTKRNRKNEVTGKWETYDSYEFDEKFSFGGHGSKSVFIIQQYMRLTPAEAAAINCHMSAWGDNADHVGDVYAQFPFAWLLSVADQASTYILEEE